jgi:hypothetical protein
LVTDEMVLFHRYVVEVPDAGGGGQFRLLLGHDEVCASTLVTEMYRSEPTRAIRAEDPEFASRQSATSAPLLGGAIPAYLPPHSDQPHSR